MADGFEDRSAAVFGGGPAGLMAAEVLIDAGLRVTVLDARRSFGRKFLLAGRGGLNITHSEPLDAFLDRYGARRPQLEAAIRAFTPTDLRSWCAGLGESTDVGTSGRVFPASFRATPLLRAWLGRLDAAGVVFASGRRWEGFATPPTADVTVLALGGASWPRVGGDGGWTEAFTAEGIEVVPLRPANAGVRVEWSSVFRDRFAGSPMKNLSVTVDDTSVRGDVVVTESGLEGGPIYAHSTAIRVGCAVGSGRVTIDLAPDLTVDELAARLSRRRPKDSAATWLRRAKLAPVGINLLREVTGGDLPDDPMAMAVLAKTAVVSVVEPMPLERAISTAGGVSFDEVDEHFMLRKVPGTFVAGEMLDWEAPTGGYLLQACFSTGAAAANGALTWLATVTA